MKGMIILCVYDGSPSVYCIENGKQINAPEEFVKWVDKKDEENCGFYTEEYSFEHKQTELCKEAINKIHALGYDAVISENGELEYFPKENKQQ